MRSRSDEGSQLVNQAQETGQKVASKVKSGDAVQVRAKAEQLQRKHRQLQQSLADALVAMETQLQMWRRYGELSSDLDKKLKDTEALVENVYQPQTELMEKRALSEKLKVCMGEFVISSLFFFQEIFREN